MQVASASGLMTVADCYPIRNDWVGGVSEHSPNPSNHAANPVNGFGCALHAIRVTVLTVLALFKR